MHSVKFSASSKAFVNELSVVSSNCYNCPGSGITVHLPYGTNEDPNMRLKRKKPVLSFWISHFNE